MQKNLRWRDYLGDLGESAQFANISWISFLTFAESFRLPWHQQHLCLQLSCELKPESTHYEISDEKIQVARAVDSATIPFASENWSQRKGGWTSTLLGNLLLNFYQFLVLDVTRCQK